jgi:hypothetical protein
MDGWPRNEGVAVDIGLLGNCRAMASAYTPSVLSQSMPTFHNYEPRIVATDGKGSDGLLDPIIVGGNFGMIDIAY